MGVSTSRRRAHGLLPDELLREIDGQVGPRRRSEFMQEAIEEKLNQLRRIEAFGQVVGSIADGQAPEWDSRESAAAWVGRLRVWERTGE